jgi:hypothetical protein
MRTLRIQDTAGHNDYFSIIDPTGKFFDFADNTLKALLSKAVNGVNAAGAGSGWFKCATDVTASLTTGKKIRIRGSTGNDGVYTIRAGSSFSGGNTQINVSEAVPNATANGTIDLNATPYLTATEQTDPGGSSSYYIASLDMTLVHTSGDLMDFAIAAYTPVGTFPVPATDTIIGTPERLQLEYGFEGSGRIELKFNPVFESTAGTTFDLCASLSRNGYRIPLETYAPAATLALAVRQYGAGADLFTIAATTVNALGRFELTKASPGFTADRLYWYRATLVENGNTWVFEDTVPNHG